MIATSGSDVAAPTPGVVPKLPVRLDTKGRVRVSKAQRQVILGEFERSGETVPQFARRAGLKYSTFVAWVARSRRARRRARKTPLRLVEAVLPPAPAPAAVWVQLPGGARLEIQAASQVPLAAALVHALAKPC